VGDDQSFPADKYDLIFANAVIHWIVDKARALEKIYASLKPGGCFVFTTLNQPSFSLFETILGPTITNDTLQSLHWESKEFYNDLALSTFPKHRFRHQFFKRSIQRTTWHLQRVN
jgi:SAM-dependent methyltransferase